MEAMILAKPAPTQNDARQPDSPISPESNGEEFAPVLDAEINRSNDKTEAANDAQTTEATEATDQTDTDTLAEPESDATATIIQAAGISSLDIIPTALQGNAEITTDSAPLQFNATAANTAADISVEINSNTNSIQLQQSDQKTAVLTADSLEQLLTKNTSPKENGAPQTSQTPQPSRAETLLIEQIQQLLSKNQNNGPISIESTGFKAASTPAGATNNILASNTGEVQIAQQLSTITVPVQTNTEEKGKTTSLEGTRQDTTNQFLKAKMGKSVTANNDPSQQSAPDQEQANSQNKESMQTAAPAALSTSATTATTDGQSIGQFSMLTPTTTTAAQTPIEGKLAPGAHLPIQQHEIVDNLIQRFSVNPRLKTGNISIQLNPVELGALKININVKDDTINANIIAQSQQIIDTIDKHMPKLRAVLEDQGFTIDTFQVTLDSKTDSHHELFQEQFASQQQSSFTGSQSSAFEDESFEAELNSAALPEMSETSGADSSGVNLTV